MSTAPSAGADTHHVRMSLCTVSTPRMTCPPITASLQNNNQVDTSVVAAYFQNFKLCASLSVSWVRVRVMVASIGCDVCPARGTESHTCPCTCRVCAKRVTAALWVPSLHQGAPVQAQPLRGHAATAQALAHHLGTWPNDWQRWCHTPSSQRHATGIACVLTWDTARGDNKHMLPQSCQAVQTSLRIAGPMQHQFRPM